jgi:hypothetical protein
MLRDTKATAPNASKKPGISFGMSSDRGLREDVCGFERYSDASGAQTPRADEGRSIKRNLKNAGSKAVARLRLSFPLDSGYKLALYSKPEVTP